MLAGATRETGSGFDARVTAGGLHQVLDAALALAPGLIDATLVEVRVASARSRPGWSRPSGRFPVSMTSTSPAAMAPPG